MAERPTYSAVEKRAVYSQKGVINTSFEMMGSNELHVPLHPSNLYTRSLDRDPHLGGCTDERAAERLRHHHAAASWQQAKSSSVDVYHHGSVGSPRDYDSASHQSMSPGRPTRTPTPNTLQVPSPHAAYSPPHTSSTMSPAGGGGGGSSSRDHSPTRNNTMSPQIKPKVTITTVTSAADGGSTLSGGSVSMLVGMKLDVSSVWLGSVRGKTTSAIVLHGHGIKIPFLYKDTGAYFFESRFSQQLFFMWLVLNG